MSVSIAAIQRHVRRAKRTRDVSRLLLDLQVEMSEIFKAARAAGYGPSPGSHSRRHNLEVETTQCLHRLVELCDAAGIDLEAAVTRRYPALGQ